MYRISWKIACCLLNRNGYSWVEGNVVNAVDPSGMSMDFASMMNNSCQNTESVQVNLGNCQQVTGATDCERFVAEVKCIINQVKQQTPDWAPADAFALDALAGYFSGRRLSGRFLGREWYLGWLPQRGNPDASEHYDLPEFISLHIGSFYGTSGNDGWRHPFYFRYKQDYVNPDVVNNPNVDWQEVVNGRLAYGFKRPFYTNTHHYFGLLRDAYTWQFTWPLSLIHEGERVESIYSTYQSLLQSAKVQDRYEAPFWYKIQFYDTAADLFLDTQARHGSQLVYNFGVEALPDWLRNRWCAETEEEIWSLDDEISSYGQNFRGEVQP